MELALKLSGILFGVLARTSSLFKEIKTGESQGIQKWLLDISLGLIRFSGNYYTFNLSQI